MVDEREADLTVGDLAQLLGFLSGTFVFLFLIGWDLWNSIKKGANWVPGHALVLSALTIQALNFVENQGALLDQMLDSSKPLSGEVVKDDLFMIHSSRVMLCVLVAFFLPGMAGPSYQEKWTKLIAVGLSIFLDIFSELLSVRRSLGDSGLYLATYFIYTWPHAKQVNVLSFIVSGAIISMTLLCLLVLLTCAILASKGIRKVTTRRALFILGKPKYGPWKVLEDQVLKSWIVYRACHPESIIASSVIASSAAFGVTVCIISSIVGWIIQGPAIKLVGGAGFWLKFIITIMEITFILIGWAIIGWRWLTSVAYYGHQWENQSWSQYFEVEDFWTRHIVELREAEDSKRRILKVKQRISKIFARKLKNLKVDEKEVRVITIPEVEKKNSLKSIFLVCVYQLQRLVVFLCKANYFLSEFILYTKLIRCLVNSILLRNHISKVKEDYAKDKDILENVNVLWQTSLGVFSTNRKSIQQAKEIMAKGITDGGSCHVLINLLHKYRSPSRHHVDIACLDPAHPGSPELNFLFKDDEVLPGVPTSDVEKYFMYASKRSWKLTAVSLITIIIRLSPPSGTVSRDCLQVYYEAWELMDLVESSDPETHSLLSKAADSLFNTRNSEQPKSAIQAEKAIQAPKTMDPEEAKTTIQTLAKECADEFYKRAKIIDEGKDSPQDWELLVARSALYKLCNSISCSSGNFEELKTELQNSLEDVIGGCLDRVWDALVDNCRKWAQDLEERKLTEALYIAGKFKGLADRLGVEQGPRLRTAEGVYLSCSN